MSEIINKTGDLTDDFNREPEVPEFIIETDDDQKTRHSSGHLNNNEQE